jgi:hypothetical protein
MNKIEISDIKILKIVDLLEQIKAVDEMISLHGQKGDADDIMLIQYQYRRENFIKDLKVVLEELNIRLGDVAA